MSPNFNDDEYGGMTTEDGSGWGGLLPSKDEDDFTVEESAQRSMSRQLATLRAELEACKLEQDAFARECILAYSEQPAREKSAMAAIARVRRTIQEDGNG